MVLNQQGEKLLTHDNRLSDALDLLIDALRLLDTASAPPDIGAHVDLAIHRLRASLGSEKQQVGDLCLLPRSSQG